MQSYSVLLDAFQRHNFQSTFTPSFPQRRFGFHDGRSARWSETFPLDSSVWDTLETPM